MNARTEFQTILDADGRPVFVVMPYNAFCKMRGGFTPGTVPNEVVGMAFDGGMSPVRAWREYLRLTQAEVAARIGITQAAFAQMEAAKRPRKATLAKVAAALGVEVEQLDF